MEARQIFIFLALAIASGCATAPSAESRAAARAMMEACDFEASYVNRRAAKELCLEFDKEFTREELEEIRAIYSDPQVRALLRNLPDSIDALDARIRELSEPEVFEKLQKVLLENEEADGNVSPQSVRTSPRECLA